MSDRFFTIHSQALITSPNIEMCKSETMQSYENRAQSFDTSKAWGKTVICALVSAKMAIFSVGGNNLNVQHAL